MKKRFLFLGNAKQRWILRELFYDVDNGKVENAEYLSPYAFPTEAIEKKYFNSYKAIDRKGMGLITAPRWRQYSILNDLEIAKDETVYLFYVMGRDIQRLYDPIQLDFLKKRWKNQVITCLLLFDSISVTQDFQSWEHVTETFSHFDAVATFDREDAAKYDLIWFMDPYPKRDVIPDDARSTDLYFIGSDQKERFEELSAIARKIAEHGGTCRFMLTGLPADAELEDGIYSLENSIPYIETLGQMINSSCVLELLAEGQSSPSLRYYEAITYKKKLLTNNKNIVNFPFYDPRYMQYFSSVEDIDVDWLSRKESVDYNYQDEFATGPWLEKLVGEIDKRLKEYSGKKLTKKPLVSVVIPTYNRRDLIMRSVDSVLNQTYSNLELIIVDDGSTDGTLELLSEVEDDRLRIVKQNHGGACAARNKGIDSARGSLIAFQDSDDEWALDKLEKQVKALLKHPECDVVFCNAIRKGFVSDDELLVPIEESRMVDREELQRRSLVSTQTILARKECFDYERFDLEMPRLQDYDLVIRLSEAFAFYFVAEPLAYMYVQDDSISSNPAKAVKARKRILEKYPVQINRSTLMYKSVIGSILHNLNLMDETDQDAEREMHMIRKYLILDKENKKLKKKNAEIYSSFSYRVGHTITWLPRKMNAVLKKIKNMLIKNE